MRVGWLFRKLIVNAMSIFNNPNSLNQISLKLMQCFIRERVTVRLTE